MFQEKKPPGRKKFHSQVSRENKPCAYDFSAVWWVILQSQPPKEALRNKPMRPRRFSVWLLLSPKIHRDHKFTWKKGAPRNLCIGIVIGNAAGWVVVQRICSKAQEHLNHPGIIPVGHNFKRRSRREHVGGKPPDPRPQTALRKSMKNTGRNPKGNTKH